MKQYVIIGGGVAAVGCIEGIRSQDQEGKIIMIAGEGCPVYCRPLISYYLQGKKIYHRMFFHCKGIPTFYLILFLFSYSISFSL